MDSEDVYKPEDQSSSNSTDIDQASFNKTQIMDSVEINAAQIDLGSTFKAQIDTAQINTSPIVGLKDDFSMIKMKNSRGAILVQLALNKQQAQKVKLIKEAARNKNRRKGKLELDTEYSPNSRKSNTEKQKKPGSLTPRTKVRRWLKFPGARFTKSNSPDVLTELAAPLVSSSASTVSKLMTVEALLHTTTTTPDIPLALLSFADHQQTQSLDATTAAAGNDFDRNCLTI